MAQHYYVRDDKGRVAGPYSGEMLRQFAREGKLLPSWQISPDLERWTTAAKVQNLFTDLDYALSANVARSHQYRDLSRKEQIALFIDTFILNSERFKDSMPWLQTLRTWWAKLTLPSKGFVITEVTAAGVRHVKYDFTTGHTAEIDQKDLEKQVSDGIRQFNWFAVLCYFLGVVWAVWAVKDFIVEFSPTFGTLKTLLVTAVAVAGFIYKTKQSKVFLGYVLDPAAEQKLSAIREAFVVLRRCGRVWAYKLQAHANEKSWKYNAGSLFSVAKQPVVLFNRPIPNVETNIRVCGLTYRRRAIYFLPEKLLVIDGGEILHVEYARLAVLPEYLEYVESGGNIFSDTLITDQRWKYINRDGSRDKRFKDNVQLPVVRCGILRLDAAGARVDLMTTNPDAPGLFKQQLPVGHGGRAGLYG